MLGLPGTCPLGGAATLHRPRRSTSASVCFCAFRTSLHLRGDVPCLASSLHWAFLNKRHLSDMLHIAQLARSPTNSLTDGVFMQHRASCAFCAIETFLLGIRATQDPRSWHHACHRAESMCLKGWLQLQVWQASHSSRSTKSTFTKQLEETLPGLSVLTD